MRPRAHYFLIGVFVLLGIVATIVTVLMVGAGAWVEEGLIVETYFQEPVQGLERGAHVRFRGVKMGEVTEISLVSARYDTTRPYALVRARLTPIRPDTSIDELRRLIEQRIREGFRVRLASLGLTGSLYLEIDLVADTVEPVHDLEVDFTPEFMRIPSAPSTISRIGVSLERVLGQLGHADLPGLVDDARNALASLDESIAGADLRGLRERTERTLESADQLLAQARADLRTLTDHTTAMLDEGKGFIAELRVSASGERVERILDGVERLTESLQPVGGELRDTLAAARATVTELRQELRTKGRDVDVILDGLRQITTHLAGLADTLERYPSLILFGSPPPHREPGK